MNIDGHDIDISNPDKLLFADAGISKADLVDYYRRIAPHMLPHIRNRPLTLHRFPDGIDSEGFYQQHASDYFPDWMARARLPKESGGHVEHCVCNDTATLVYLAGQAVITPHAWLARTDAPRQPDRMVFDLDPDDDDFTPVRLAARTIRGILGQIGLASFVMTTGSRGLHVVVPLAADADFDTIRDFAQRIAGIAAAREPGQLTTAQRKDQRGRRVYLDIMRNAYGQTAVAPYAVRARPGAPVAMPLAWGELGDGRLRADSYRIGNTFRRLGQKHDPWQGIGRCAASMATHESSLAELERDAA